MVRKHKLSNKSLTDDEAMELILEILQESDSLMSSTEIMKQLKKETGADQLTPQFVGNLLAKRHRSHHVERIRGVYGNYKYRLKESVIYVA